MEGGREAGVSGEEGRAEQDPRISSGVGRDRGGDEGVWRSEAECGGSEGRRGRGKRGKRGDRGKRGKRGDRGKRGKRERRRKREDVGGVCGGGRGGRSGTGRAEEISAREAAGVHGTGGVCEVEGVAVDQQWEAGSEEAAGTGEEGGGRRRGRAGEWADSGGADSGGNLGARVGGGEGGSGGELF